MILPKKYIVWALQCTATGEQQKYQQNCLLHNQVLLTGGEKELLKSHYNKHTSFSFVL